MRTRLVVILATTVVALAATGAASAQDRPAPSRGTRLAMQGRIDALNLFGVARDPDSPIDITGASDITTVVPLATLGVRLVEGKLFLGLGFGFYGYSFTTCGNDGCDDDEETTSFGGWALTPL